MSSRRRRGTWRWVLLIAAIIVLGAVLGLRAALRTPTGRAAFNIVEYRARSVWRRWVGERETNGAPGGAIAGVVREENGGPLVGATVLVATVKGAVYQAESDDQGTYRIEDVPPGRYVVAASQWGYDDAVYHEGGEERTLVSVRSGQLQAGVDLALRLHQPWRATLDDPPIIGPTETGYALFPAEVAASRVPITYTSDGLVITTTLLYEPLGIEITESLPVVVATYPSEPINWDRVSVALANEGYVVLATGPSPQRALDIPGMGRDLIKAVAYLRQGQLTDRADVEREGWLAGSFSSLILYRALLEDPGGVDALVLVGAISDGFLGVQSLYDVELEIPPRYADAVAALGRPDRYPEFYIGYSPAYHASELPPALVVHTYTDEVVPYNQSLRLAGALEAAGVPYDLYLYEDTTHYLDQVNMTPDTAELYRRLAVFLDRYVRRGGAG
ncbi:MAG: carboxypeptidase regulatory-like domain-containing protein [Anaerolineae bacterium]|nr:carboxypeptidase regulatory-like domain-containing protein [Anaerolineae bacterium]